MDTTLPWYSRLAVKIHLLYCIWCRRYATQLRRLRKATSQLSPEEFTLSSQKLSTQAKEEMRARVQQALKDVPPAPQ